MLFALALTLALNGPATDPHVQDGWLPPPLLVELASPEKKSEKPREDPPLPPLIRVQAGTEQWRPLVAGHFEPGDVDRVLCLMGFESGGDPSARNRRSGASGLLQVMPFWADHYGLARSDLFIPEINLWVARKIRDSQGWTAWSPYKRGECR